MRFIFQMFQYYSSLNKLTNLKHISFCFLLRLIKCHRMNTFLLITIAINFDNFKKQSTIKYY